MDDVCYWRKKQRIRRKDEGFMSLLAASDSPKISDLVSHAVTFR